MTATPAAPALKTSPAFSEVIAPMAMRGSLASEASRPNAATPSGSTSPSFDGVKKTGVPFPREIYLSHISGDDRLTTFANPRKEHLHLFASGILSLVQDHVAVIETSPAHVGKRG